MTASLRITGAVEQEREFSFSDLAAIPSQLCDISQLIPGRQGSGIRLQNLLDSSGVEQTATHVTLTSTDGCFSACIPLCAARAAIVAYRLGDQPLPSNLGGPFRFFIPDVDACAIGGVDACANVKFLGRLHLSVGPSVDTRPTSKTAHEELHRQQR